MHAKIYEGILCIFVCTILNIEKDFDQFCPNLKSFLRKTLKQLTDGHGKQADTWQWKGHSKTIQRSWLWSLCVWSLPSTLLKVIWTQFESSWNQSSFGGKLKQHHSQDYINVHCRLKPVMKRKGVYRLKSQNSQNAHFPTSPVICAGSIALPNSSHDPWMPKTKWMFTLSWVENVWKFNSHRARKLVLIAEKFEIW